MTSPSPMRVIVSSLLDLARALDARGLPLVLCGGLGLYLKQIRLQEGDIARQPLLPGSLWPRPRATEDVDILLPAETIADRDRCLLFRQVLDDLGYQPIESAKYMQFVRPLGHAMDVKVDLLTGPVPADRAGDVRVKDRRIRPAGPSVGLHAHRTDEAIEAQTRLQAIEVDGACTDGRPYRATIGIPPPVTFLMMKLFALRDRCHDSRKGFGRHHALDLYRIVAMMSPEEFRETRQAVIARGAEPVVCEARRIVADMFSSDTAVGVIRLRQHPLFEAESGVDVFAQALADLFAEG